MCGKNEKHLSTVTQRYSEPVTDFVFLPFNLNKGFCFMIFGFPNVNAKGLLREFSGLFSLSLILKEF